MSETEIVELGEQDIDQGGELVPRAVATPALTVDDLLARQQTVHDAMTRAMKPDVHFGKIPGVNKPTLLKPGAEMLCVLFQLGPFYPEERQKVERDPVSDHLDVRSLCVLRHIPTGLEVAEGLGYASTREKKYAYRGGVLACPDCGEAAVQKGKTRDKQHDQFYCYRKKGGCGATWDEGSDRFVEFEEQRKLNTSRVPNPDLPDTYNTVLKMGAKRALIAATLNATGASDVFTQDVEDQPGPAGDSSTREPVKKDPPSHPPLPTSWAGLTDAFEKEQVDAEWLAQAVEAKFGKPLAELDAETRRTAAFQFVKRAYVALYEILGAKGRLEFPGATRAELREVFAAVLDGVVLEGPPWRIHPVTYDEGEAAYPLRVGGELDPDAENIPFGEQESGYPAS